jgi:hypothetical protein
MICELLPGSVANCLQQLFERDKSVAITVQHTEFDAGDVRATQNPRISASKGMHPKVTLALVEYGKTSVRRLHVEARSVADGMNCDLLAKFSWWNDCSMLIAGGRLTLDLLDGFKRVP